jgi:predicted aspartyl protease
MRRITASLVAVTALSAFANAAEAPKFDPVLDADPFAAEAMLAHPTPGQSPALRHYLRGFAAGARLETKKAEHELRLAYSDPHAPSGVVWRALAAAGQVAMRAGQYDVGADLMDRAISEHGEEMPSAIRSNFASDRDGAMALRGQPAQTIEDHPSGTVPLARNALGLITVPVAINGHDQAAVVDTGTSMSAVSVTAAKALGVRMLTRKTSTGTATTQIETTMGMIDTLKIGPATLHNVAVIVISDAALSPMGPENRIDVIVGYPVLSALMRISFASDGAQPEPHRTLTFGTSDKGKPGDLRFVGSDFMVRVAANNQTLTLYVDSGANTTYLDKRYAREFPERVAGLATKDQKSIGGAGMEIHKVAVVPSFDIEIGGTHVPLQNVTIDLEGKATDTLYGTVGMDTLWAKGGYTIDFAGLNLSLGR